MPRERPVDTSCHYVQHGGVYQCDTCGDVVREPKRRKCPSKFDPSDETEAGVGSELARVLHRFGINPKPGCGCEKLRREMDAMGPDQCLAHVDQLATKLQRQAVKRRWILSGSAVTHFAAKRLILFAIRKARAS